MNFADRLLASIKRSKSFICAGFDPVLDSMPSFILEEAAKRGSNEEESVFLALTSFYALALEALNFKVAAIKPNIAFFEQYGLGGLRAFKWLCSEIKNRGLPLIVDGKRGDIGSTAKAYSTAYLGQAKLFGKLESAFDADALTVNPYLGFDTIESFFDDCLKFGKGLFVLVKTSNPGSNVIQGRRDQGNKTVSEVVAEWLAANAKPFEGECGYSALGAVVGATYPNEARALRAIMPKNIFLIPGLGSQGGTAADAVAGFDHNKNGAIINISRGLFSFKNEPTTKEQCTAEIGALVDDFNRQITGAL